ncbi:MAG: hypothetical protein WB686_07060, partial [Pseudolabrys sp.]
MTASHPFLGAAPQENANAPWVLSCKPKPSPDQMCERFWTLPTAVAGRVVGYTGRPVQVCPGYV